jgi:hypothetical protein
MRFVEEDMPGDSMALVSETNHSVDKAAEAHYRHNGSLDSTCLCSISPKYLNLNLVLSM